MKKILQLDGGGIRGLIQLPSLVKIEKDIGKPISELFDLIVGTSVGSIIGGILSTGRVSAEELNDLFYGCIDEVFKKRFFRTINFVGNGKYDRKALVDLLNDKLGYHTLMNACKTKFICTSVCVNDGRNHYFKSWEDKDSKENLVSIINRSYAAPYYFDPISTNGKTWIDGGTGNSNCSLDEALIEIIMQKWNEEEHSVLSLGTGHSKIRVPYKKSKKYKNIRSTLFFANPMEGGLARTQSTSSKVRLSTELSNSDDNFNFQRIDCTINKMHDKLDGLKYKDLYLILGKGLSKEIDYEKLGF